MSSIRAITLTLLLAVPFAACGGRTPAPDTQPPATPPATAAPDVPAEIPPAETLKGTVREVLNASGYTYVRLQTSKGEFWIAAPEFSAAPGDALEVAVDLPMRDFHSKALDRDFAEVYFAVHVTRDGHVLQSALAADQIGSPTPPAERMTPPPGGLNIEDVWARRGSLAGTHVVVRGRVMKVTNNVLERNWLHLQDGSGAADKGTHDLTVTTSATVVPGDVVKASGVVGVDKDFGAGYSYAVILEGATIEK